MRRRTTGDCISSDSFVAYTLLQYYRTSTIIQISDGGVHSHINHAVALVKAARDRGIGQTYIHFFADGRDTAPTSAGTQSCCVLLPSGNEFVLVKYLDDLQGELRRLNYGRIATITGRYFAMDRDKRWERIKVAFDALTGGVGEESSDPAEVC